MDRLDWKKTTRLGAMIKKERVISTKRAGEHPRSTELLWLSMDEQVYYSDRLG